jgi:hypothetical protein
MGAHHKRLAPEERLVRAILKRQTDEHFPTVRQISKALHMSHAEVIDMAGWTENVDVLVAFANAAGYADIDNSGDYMLEYYGEDA